MITPTERIGMKWAKTISKEFQDWADTEKKSRKIKIAPFNPKPQLKLAFYEAGASKLDDIGKIVGMGVSFDLKSPEAIAWIESYGSSQVKYVSATTKAAIRQISSNALRNGLSPDETAREIKKIIGLLPRQVLAVQNYQASLIESGMDDSSIQSSVDKYAQKLLRLRADTIGLTESHTATNEGAIQATEGAVERGVLSENEYQLEWLYTSDNRACELCQSYDGTHAPIGGTFPNGMRGPPAHPRCRCTTVIVKR